jgi:general secretion pathway protein D
VVLSTFHFRSFPGAKWLGPFLALGFAALAVAGGAGAQSEDGTSGIELSEEDRVQLDFNDVELKVVIDTIARLTGRNFIYDDRVRGKITVVSPTSITIDEAYAVFESVLRVKGFTTVEAPGGVIKIIPLSEAKESNVELESGAGVPPASERFVTRLIPLRYIDAAAIAETLRPFVSRDALLVAYAPTNTVILTDSATNIGRILSVVQAIDVETYRAELTRIQLEHADPGTVAAQLSEIFGAEVSAVGGGGARPPPSGQGGNAPKGAELASKGGIRIITDERTNALFVLASRQRMEEIRDVVAKLDVPVTGWGRIHIYRIKHADAEELAKTLAGILSGQAGPAAGGANAGEMRASISEFASGITVTADPPTNSIVVQATAEGYVRLRQVIEGLDVPRPQVLVEALIMEVDVTDALDLGFSGLVRIQDGEDGRFVVGSLTDAVLGADEDDEPSGVLDALLGAIASTPANFVGGAAIDAGSTLIQGLIRASASVNGTNILSAPHILTLDNEEAEIKVGDNIPIITSRVQSAAGIETSNDNGSLATSQNIERQDIGITLRVTPQISEGDRLRLQIFQEVTAVNEGLTGVTGSVDQVGVALSNRKIENVVTVADEDTVVIGGLIDESQGDNESKVPWLGDIPILGWLFKTTGDSIRKRNLLVFLTPHIIRDPAHHVAVTIRKREEFSVSSEDGAQLSDSERADAERRRERARQAGLPELPPDPNPVRARLEEHRGRYPVEIMREIEGGQPRSAKEESSVIVESLTDGEKALRRLLELRAAGHSCFLVSVQGADGPAYELRIAPP